MAKPAGQLIREEDFLELTYQVTVCDPATGREVPNTDRAAIAELRARGLVMILSRESCRQGQRLELRIMPRLPKAPPSRLRLRLTGQTPSDPELETEKLRALRRRLFSAFTLVARARLVQISRDGKCRVELEIEEVDRVKWDGFLETFAECQASIHELVRLINT